MNVRTLAVAIALSLASAPLARAEEPAGNEPAPTTTAVTQFVQLGDVTFYRSYEDAFPKARKEGKLVLFYRMLGELDGST